MSACPISAATKNNDPVSWKHTQNSNSLNMPDKSEKERRKQIMNDLRQKADEEFEASLPISRDIFKQLFDHLDTELSKKGCDDTSSLTQDFLKQHEINNIDAVLTWLSEYGGYCDCEILANVEDHFE